MKSNYHPWQSWSPPTPNWVHLPSRDYCPVPQTTPRHQKPKHFSLKPPVSGWCSWYTFGPLIKQKIIFNQARTAFNNKLPLQYILIDDGWCKWGDWQKPNHIKFPQGIKSINMTLQRFGFKTGLWLAPFLVSPQADLVDTHPNWLVINSFHHLIDAHKLTPFDRILPWRKYLLDYTNPQVTRYLYQSIDTIITEWHVSLLKLDFLYAPYFLPGLKDDQLPHQALTDLFTYIRKHHPNVYLMACGCPYNPARYLADSIRVAKDIIFPSKSCPSHFNRYVYLHRFNSLNQRLNQLTQDHPPYRYDPDVIITNTKIVPSHTQMKKHLSLIENRHLPFFLGDDLTALEPAMIQLLKTVISDSYAV